MSDQPFPLVLPPSIERDLKEGLLFWRKEPTDFYVAVAVLSDSVWPGSKSFWFFF